MKKLLLLFLIFSTTLTAQKKNITLEDIWSNGTFSGETLKSFHSMNKGDFYTLLNLNQDTRSTSVDKYDYKTLEKIETVVDSKDLHELPYFESYEFDQNENKLLLGTESEKIYRHSSKDTYYVYDIASKKLQLVSKHKIQEPAFSPDGNKVAFVYENNIYVKDLITDITIQVTTDGEKNFIINGVADWVYEEEFSFVRAFQWNSDSDKIAFLRFDETEVPEFSMDVYGQSLYPKQQVFKYPKAGEKNAVVTLHMFNLKEKSSKQVNLGELVQHYIPRIKWSNEPNILAVTTLNRHQNNLNLIFVDGNTLESKLILNEKDAAYVDITDDLTFLKDNSFLWTSEKDGFNHIYHYDASGKLKNKVTDGNWEVSNYYGFDPKTKRIFYQSTEGGSINRTVFSIKLNGKDKKLLSSASGTNSAAFSNSFNYFVNTFSSANTPDIYTLNEAKSGKQLKEIKNNKELSEKLNGYNISKKEFFTLKTENGHFNAWMIKPTDFDPNKKYPLLMYQYSGPGSQSVANRWGSNNDFWYQMLAQKGYIIACVDGRGTGFRGRDFKKATYMNLVKLETIDQINSAKELSELPYIDKDRIGIWGWSYGGHMATNALLKGSDVFSTAIAVAPVTSWRFYDTVYTERYMRTPEENPSGYDDNSPFNYPELLKGNYLLIHGSGDDNVHLQHTMRMVEALIQADKQFDWGIYPDKNHSIYGGNTRLHLYKKMTNFIDEHLGSSKGQLTQKEELKN